MTYISKQPVKFGKVFPLFQAYWNFCRQRLDVADLTQILILTLSVFEKLQEEWKKFKWEMDELNWICYGIDNNYSILDPSNFEYDQIAYLDRAKICFYLEHNNY